MSPWPYFPNTQFYHMFSSYKCNSGLEDEEKSRKMMPHVNQGINDKHKTIDKMLLKDIYPRICWNKIWMKTRSQIYKLRHSKHTYPMSTRGCSSRSSGKAK